MYLRCGMLDLIFLLKPGYSLGSFTLHLRHIPPDHSTFVLCEPT
jgi:hypothetical protein